MYNYKSVHKLSDKPGMMLVALVNNDLFENCLHTLKIKKVSLEAEKQVSVHVLYWDDY